MIGVGLSLGARSRPFDLASLFPPGVAAIWIDPSDLATMSQDIAGTVPAAVDAPVGRIADKSGRGNHATQATAAARPMLRREADGRYALEFDGVDDHLVHPFSGPGGDMSLSCAVQRSGPAVAGDVGLFQATPPGTRLQAGLWVQTVAPNWGTYGGGAYRSAGTDANTRAVLSVVGRTAGDVQRLTTNGSQAVEFVGTYGGDANDRRAIGREFANALRGQFAGRLYALAGVARALDDEGLAGMVRYQAAQAGVRI